MYVWNVFNQANNLNTIEAPFHQRDRIKKYIYCNEGHNHLNNTIEINIHALTPFVKSLIYNKHKITHGVFKHEIITLQLITRKCIMA